MTIDFCSYNVLIFHENFSGVIIFIFSFFMAQTYYFLLWYIVICLYRSNLYKRGYFKYFFFVAILLKEYKLLQYYS